MLTEVSHSTREEARSDEGLIRDAVPDTLLHYQAETIITQLAYNGIRKWYEENYAVLYENVLKG